MAIDHLPAELLLAITRHLSSAKDIVSCVSTCQRWHWAGAAALYEYNDGHAITWALKRDRMDIVDRAVAIGVHLFQLHHLTLVAGTDRLLLAKNILQSEKLLEKWRSYCRDAFWMTPLNAAAAHGNVDMIQLLLDVPGVNFHMSACGWSAVGIASFCRNHDAVQLLLNHGFDPTQECGIHSVITPLQLAVDGADFEIATALISYLDDYIVDQELKRKHLSRALLSVANYGRFGQEYYEHPSEMLAVLEAAGVESPTPGTADDALKCAELLLAHGADVDTTVNGPNYTPLLLATRAGHTGMARMLLHHGANISARVDTYEGPRTPLFFAVCHPDVHLVQELLDRGAQIKFGGLQAGYRRAIELAARAGQPDVTKLLLLHEQATDINDSTHEDRTPLYLAALSGSYETFKLLFDHGASIQCQCADGYSPLHVANNADIAKFLLQRGIHVDTPNQKGVEKKRSCKDDEHCSETPLVRACADGRGQVIQVLLDADADPKILDFHGNTTLNLAARSGLSEAIAIFAARGVSIHQAGDDGLAPLHNAAVNNHPGAIEQLLTLGADINVNTKHGATALELGLKSLEVMQMLVKHGADINYTRRDGVTLMHKVVKQPWRDEDKSRMAFNNLVKLGADVEARDNKGYSVLHTAVKHGEAHSLRIVLERGANVNSMNNDGWTPLMTASYRPFLPAVNLLLENGADIHATVGDGSDGDTALRIAVRSGRRNVVTSLLRHGADPLSAGDEGNTKCKEILKHWLKKSQASKGVNGGAN